METMPTRPARRLIAVVSGKGGSGKTMIAAALTQILDRLGQRVLLIDGDMATAGLTYYLGLKHADNISLGLSEIAFSKGGRADSVLLKRAVRKLKGFDRAQFLGVGDYRKLNNCSSPSLIEGLSSVLDAYEDQPWILIDCRGGIDRESIEICKIVDDIILVAEPDTTAFQATRYVVDLLSANEVSHKIKGFILNKVFDDPSYVVRTGTSVFQSQFLGAIPFDFDATRSFLVGDLPSSDSPFVEQLSVSLQRAYPESDFSVDVREWNPADFKSLTITSKDSATGANMVAAMLVLLGLVETFALLSVRQVEGRISTLQLWALCALLVVTGLVGVVEPLKRALGKAINFYVKSFGAIMSRLRAWD